MGTSNGLIGRSEGVDGKMRLAKNVTPVRYLSVSHNCVSPRCQVSPRWRSPSSLYPCSPISRPPRHSNRHPFLALLADPITLDPTPADAPFACFSAAAGVAKGLIRFGPCPTISLFDVSFAGLAKVGRMEVRVKVVLLPLLPLPLPIPEPFCKRDIPVFLDAVLANGFERDGEGPMDDLGASVVMLSPIPPQLTSRLPDRESCRATLSIFRISCARDRPFPVLPSPCAVQWTMSTPSVSSL